MNDIIEKFASFKCESKPIIIWGIKTAGKICYRLLRKINADVVAAGDNNPQNIGRTLYEVPVLPLQEIEQLYPDAVIVIGSFNDSVTNSIMKQLKSSGNNFTFYRFEEIEYWYEIVFLNRNVLDREKLYRIINNVSAGESKVWKEGKNKNVLLEYRYAVMDDSAEELKDVLSDIYGIRNLVLIINLHKMKTTLKLIDKLLGYGNIGHISVVIDYKNVTDESDLKCLSEKVFYIMCDDSIPNNILTRLEDMGIIVEIKKIPYELFCQTDVKNKNALTEKDIVDSVLAYTGKKNESNISQKKLSVNPIYIVQLFNGLANQMLMYLFGRFLEEESDRIVIFDDTILNLDMIDEKENINRICKWHKELSYDDVEKGVLLTKEGNSFYKFERAEVAEVFDIPIRLLSDYFDREIWNTYLEKIKIENSHKYGQGYPLCQVLMNNGYDITIIKDNIVLDEFFPVKNCCCTDAYLWERPYKKYSVTHFMLSRNNAYFIGAWATGRADDWLIQNRQWVQQISRLRLVLNEENRTYVRKIRESDGVMIHVRRGDFAYFKIAADTKYFRKSLELVETATTYKNKKYFIFSDDTEWCREQKRELGIDKLGDRVTFVCGNTGVNSYLDLYLMSLGKVIIPTPGSTFSYLAILMSKTVEKYIGISKYINELSNEMDVMPVLIDVSFQITKY